MDLEERGDDYDEPLDKENAVEIENSYFSWSVSKFNLKSYKFVLKIEMKQTIDYYTIPFISFYFILFL